MEEGVQRQPANGVSSRAATIVPEKSIQLTAATGRQGLLKALADKPPHLFTWDNVIGLCGWVVSQGKEIAGRTADTFRWDRDWGYARREIVDLVDAGLRTSQGGIPFHLRDQVWAVLEPLTMDPEPTTDYERQMVGERHDPLPLVGGGHFLDSNMRPGDVAINTLRCLAITTVISYGMWVRRNRPHTENSDQGANPGFEEMSEVRDVLDTISTPRRTVPSVWRTCTAEKFGASMHLIQFGQNKIRLEYSRKNKDRSAEPLPGRVIY